METPSGVFCNDLPRKADVGGKTSFLDVLADVCNLNALALPTKDDVDGKADISYRVKIRFLYSNARLDSKN